MALFLRFRNNFCVIWSLTAAFLLQELFLLFRPFVQINLILLLPNVGFAQFLLPHSSLPHVLLPCLLLVQLSLHAGQLLLKTVCHQTYILVFTAKFIPVFSHVRGYDHYADPVSAHMNSNIISAPLLNEGRMPIQI